MLSICSISYNHEKYIKDWAGGILCQDPEILRATELIFCDDCSTDDTWNKFLDFLPAFNDKGIFVTYLRRPQNIGGPKNLTNCLSRAREPYIALLETDDYWLPEKLKKSFQMLANGYDAVCSEVSALMPEGRIVERAWANLGFTFPKQITIDLMRAFNVIYSCSFIGKTEIFRKGPSPEDWEKEFGLLGDYPTFAWAARNYKVGYLNEPLSMYRESNTGAAHKNREAIVAADSKVKQWIMEGKF